MSESQAVDCPICGEGFDPTAAGGWCTNSDCGEWKYDGEEVPDPVDDEPSDENPDTDEGDVGEPHDNFVPLQPDDEETPSDESETTEPRGQTADPDVAESDSETTDGDESGVEPEETIEVEPAEGGQEDLEADEDEESQGGVAESDATEEKPDELDAEGDESAEAEQDSIDTTEEEEEITCPSCNKTISADANFCPDCGEDVSDVEPGSDSVILTECPSCSADVDEDDSFCASCGENLDAHREPEPEPLAECPSCGADIDENDSFCASCGENLDAHREGTSDSTGSEEDTTDEDDDAQASETDTDGVDFDSLVLEARGETMSVTDGDKVGRQLRRIVTETGGDEDEAVRIHREHIRFVREDGQFHVMDLGTNPTRVNDTSLSKGDREPVEPGDVIGLSDVITLNVRTP